MNNQFFQTLLSKKARFLLGENPSPAKLSAINAQIESAFAVLESFLGNGTDYLLTDDSKRKVISNLSGVIGRSEKIYKPVNKFHSLEQVQKKYINTATYNNVTKVLAMPTSATVTIEMPAGSCLGIFYKANNEVTISYDTGTVLLATGGVYKWGWMPMIPLLSSGRSSFSISSASTFDIKEMVLSNVTSGITPIQSEANVLATVFNIAQSIPISNNVYFKIRTPCIYAKVGGDSNGVECGTAYKTCNYCIGNTYDIATEGNGTFGTPICLGALESSGSAISYVADNNSTFKTVQSPLLTINSPYAAKYRPFKMFESVAEGIELPSNLLALYDITNNSTPIMQNVNFYSASDERGDIAIIKDQIGITDSSKQYIITGGEYGISDLLWDTLEITKGY